MKRKVLKMEWYDAFSCVGGMSHDLLQYEMDDCIERQ